MREALVTTVPPLTAADIRLASRPPLRPQGAATMLNYGSAVDRAPQRVVDRICQHCGHPFDPVRPHQRFCRPSCR
jgi:hypothetical protein